MKLVTFSLEQNTQTGLGVVLADRILDLKKAYRNLYSAEPPNWFSDVGSLLDGGEAAMELAREVAKRASTKHLGDTLLGLDSVFYQPPIPRPGKILCIAANYAEHSKEVGGTVSEEPYIFTKLQTCLVGHRWPIPMPRVTKQLDHEIELAVVIGKRGKYISRKNALDHVAGYTVFNDVSSRDFRFHKVERYKMNWLRSKSMDGAAPNGPWLVTKDEVGDPHNLRLVQRVNGEVRQDDSTSKMTFKIQEIIQYASVGITLLPGDIISTGTPPGVGLATGKFLRVGDILESEIEKIGTLVNPIESES